MTAVPETGSKRAGEPAWSWPALAASAATYGGCIVLMALVIAPLRRGLDGDTVAATASAPFLELLAGALVLALLFGVPVMALGWWLNRRWGGGRLAFGFFVAAPPTLLVIAAKVLMAVSAGMEQPSNLIPFQPSAWTYPPNWLEVAGTALSCLFAALVYTTLAQAKRSSRAP